MTPFELSLRSELDVERQRFTNKWLFPWHRLNMPRQVVEVDDFRGGKFSVSGIRFQGQIQELYWQAIGRYLAAKVHETFRNWDESTKTYPKEMRRSSLEGTAAIVEELAFNVLEQATDTDRRLRGNGYPEQVPIYDATSERSNVSAEISRLKDAHSVLDNSGANNEADQSERGRDGWISVASSQNVVIGTGNSLNIESPATRSTFERVLAMRDAARRLVRTASAHAEVAPEMIEVFEEKTQAADIVISADAAGYFRHLANQASLLGILRDNAELLPPGPMRAKISGERMRIAEWMIRQETEIDRLFHPLLMKSFQDEG